MSATIEFGPAGYHPIKTEAELEEGGAKITLEGSLPLVLPPGIYIPPANIQNATTMDTKWITDWLEESGLNKMEGVVPETLTKRCMDAWMSTNYLTPRLDISDDRLKAFSLYVIFLSLTAELPEIKKMKGGSAKLTQTLGLVFGNIIQGKYATAEDLPDVPDKMVPIVKALYLASKQSQKDIPRFQDECTYVTESMGKALVAIPLLGHEFLEKSPESFKYYKRYSGTEAFIELGALACNVTLPPSMRQHLMFQQIMDKAASILAVTSDLKKIIPGDPINTVRYLANQRKTDLKDAFAHTLKHLEHDVTEFRLLCTTLRNMNKKNSRLERFLRHIEEYLDGNSYRV